MRIRLRFTKLGKVRFTSHRDVARMWERALRRAALPVAATEGFSPRPKMHFGLALSTSHESLGEFLDIDFREPVVPSSLPAMLTPLLPDGIDVTAAVEIERSEMSLQQAVTSCTWRIEVPGMSTEDAVVEVDRLLAADSLVITRQRKGNDVTDDLRPGLVALSVITPGAAVAPAPSTAPVAALLEAELATQPRGVRPAELLAAFDPPREEGQVCRTHQWIALDGARHEPLVSDATWSVPQVPAGAPHAAMRAS